MNKNLMAIAIASAMVIPATAAMAGDLTIYGQAQVELANTSSDQDGQDSVSNTDLLDNARGRFGLKATEDLGGKLKGIAKFEWKADTADGDAGTAVDSNGKSVGVSLTKREMMVGLKGVFGQFEGGRLRTPYKYTGGVKYDPFVTTALEARGTAAMSGKTGSGKGFGHNGFQSNMLGWRSPNWGGFTIQALYGAETDDGSYNYSLKWSIPMVEVFLAGNDEGKLDCKGGASTCSADSYSAIKFGGQLRLGGGNHKISLQYEDTSYNETANKRDPSYFFLGYDGKFGGKTHFVAQIGAASYSDKMAGATGADKAYSDTYVTIGAIYKFSKQTRVYGGLKVTADDIETENNSATTWTIGIRKDFKS